MVHIDLFSGIGGFALAAKWAGLNTIVFCEIDTFCQKILAKNFPNVQIYPDVKNLTVDSNGNLIYIDDLGNVNMGCIKNQKYNQAKNLYESGLSIENCAKFYGISRQAMHKILIRRNTKFRDNIKFKEDNHFYRGGIKASDRAHNIVEQAIIKGILKRKSQCEICGDTGCFKDGRSKIQAHHDDYNKPLDVRWLCKKCHHDWHINNKAIGENETHGEKIDILTAGFP
jgi:transposase-like protein